MSRLELLEERVKRLEKAFIAPERRAPLAEVRAELVRWMNRDGYVDYLEFCRLTGYPYQQVEKVLRELDERKLITVD